MSYSAAEGRQEVLDVLATATEEIALALASLGEAYEQLDEHAADRLEADLFGPVQHAYGRAQRTHRQFAERYDLPRRTFEPRTVPPGDAKGAVQRGAEASAAADAKLGELQDSMLPVDVGDPELRAGLSEVRELLGGVQRRARELLRTLGR